MRVELGSGTPAELALPPSGPPLRGLVLAPDMMGLRPLFDDMAAGLAARHGWSVCVVEPFAGRESLPLEERLGASIDVERIVTDLQLAADLVQERSQVGRVGVLGFSMGGMNAFRAAGTGRFDRAVSFYGMIRPAAPWSSPGSDPLDALARPECCPVLAICGGADHLVPRADIAALQAAGGQVSVRVYDDADHGFVHDPSHPTHRADDAADAWRWTTDFLA